MYICQDRKKIKETPFLPLFIDISNLKNCAMKKSWYGQTLDEMDTCP